MSPAVDALRGLARDEALGADDRAQLDAVLRALRADRDGTPISLLVAAAERRRRGTVAAAELGAQVAVVLRALAFKTNALPFQ